jgi:hypothetical protein
MAADTVILGIIIGTLAAIVYSLRVLILLERRIARMDLNIESLTRKVLSEELRIEQQELAIVRKLNQSRPAKKAPAKKKTSSKKSAKKSSKKATSKKKSSKKRK